MASKAKRIGRSTPPVNAEAQRLAEWSERAHEWLPRHPARAGGLAERALELARSLGDDLRVARNLLTLGSARIAQREYAAAAAELREASAIAQRLGDRALRADILRPQLRSAFFAADYQAALQLGLQALSLCEQMEDPRRLALAHNDLGSIYGALNDYAAALEHLRTGLRLLREVGEDDLSNLHNNIGNIYMGMSQPAQALEFFRAALDDFRVHRRGAGEGIALGNIGRALGGLGDHAAALDAYRQSLRFWQEESDARYLAPALARVATAYAAIGDDAAAREHFEQSLGAVEAGAGVEFGDEVLLAAGTFHLQRGEMEAAIRLLSRSLALLPADESSQRVYELHRLLAGAHERLGNVADALRHFKEFHRIREAVADAAATIRIRGLMLQFDVERARQREEIYRLKNIELAQANDKLRALHEEVQARNRQLQQLSIEDSLTGLHNRRYLDSQLEHEVGRAVRRRRPLSVAICDIDYFKRINDRFSHGVGDEVLRVMGQLFMSTVRQEDIVARYGGEEFVVILPETDLDGAHALAERLRVRVAAHPWQRIHAELQVSLSIGLAEFGEVRTPDELLAAADARLYEAKRAGRDRICR